MRRVLFIAYYFPPLGGIGSVRTTSFARHLGEHGWEATVLAPSNGAYHRDPELAFPEARVIRTPSIELSRTGKRLLRTGGSDSAPAEIGRARRLPRALVRRYAYFPDGQIGWYPTAVTRALRQVPTANYDAIFSTSFPITSHLIARTLHRRLGIPWVAEFRDPWSHHLEAEGRSGLRATRFERNLAQAASAIVTVSPTWARMFSESWNRDVSVITNGHDGAAPRSQPIEEGAFTLGYAGTFYPERQNLDALWTAVGSHNQHGAPVATIKVIGDYDDALAARAAACGAGELLRFTGYLPHAAVADELARCTALVVAGPPSSGGVDRGWIVAKIFEYLATDRPIIYIGASDTDAASLLSGFGGTHVVATRDVEGAIKALRAARDEVVIRDASAFTRQSLTTKLATLLDQVCA